MPDQQESGDKDEDAGVEKPIDLGKLALVEQPPTVVPFDKTVAREVARVLLFTFAATVVATFLTIGLIYGLSASPSQAHDFVKAFVDVIPVMENFITKIFGPLLAFILGYY